MGQGSSKDVQQLRAQTDACLWSVLRGESTEFEPITIFEHTYRPDDAPIVQALLENGIQQLKKLRHPSIVKFQWVQRAEDAVSIVTEPVAPLSVAIVGELEADELCYGLYTIGKGLQFLHEDAGGLAHGNLYLECLFVGEPDGDWRLGHLEHTKSSKDLDVNYLRDTTIYRDSRTVTPEETASLAGNGTMDGSSAQARDMFAFGNLAVDLLENTCAADNRDAGRFLEYAKRELLSPSPRTRPSMAKVLQHAYFANNALVKAKLFLKNITVKTTAEKERFFANLKRSLKKFPPGLVVRQLLRQLLSRVMLTEPAMEGLVNELLCPQRVGGSRAGGLGGGVLPEAEYRDAVIPLLLELFRVKDLRVRLALLPSIAQYSSLFTHAQLDGIVLPELRLGLADSNDVLARATMQALTDVATQYSGSIMGGSRRVIFADTAQRAQALLPALAVETGDDNPMSTQVPGSSVHAGNAAVDASDQEEEEEDEDDVLTPEHAEIVGQSTRRHGADGHAPTTAEEEGAVATEGSDASDWGGDDWGGDDDDFGKPNSARATDPPPHTADAADNTDGGAAGDASDDDKDDEAVLTPEDPVQWPRSPPQQPSRAHAADAALTATATTDARTTATATPPLSAAETAPAPPQKKKGLQLSGKAKKVIKKRDSTGGDADTTGARGDNAQHPTPTAGGRATGAAATTTSPAGNKKPVPTTTPTAKSSPKSSPKPQPAPPSPEPDFFADMAPQIVPGSASLLPDPAVGGDVAGTGRSPGSGRLAAVAVNVDGATDPDADGDGWDDDDEDGWGNDDSS